MSETEQAYRRAARAVCGHCDFPEKWAEAKKGLYRAWWHSNIENPTIVRDCTAWAIWDLIETDERQGAARA